MVLGLSIGRKSRKSKDTGPVVRASPSLPELSAQGIPWPENLVDLPSVQAVRQQKQSPPTTKTKSSGFPFHKPFRSATTTNGTSKGLGSTIASLYTNKPVPKTINPNLNHSRSQRRRVAPTLNIMVAGARGTGKTSLLKLFLETSEISSTATQEQKQSVESFMSKSRKSTRALQTACVEIAESRFDRVLLTLIDTPGLNFGEGKELSLERSVAALVKYFDIQYDETMGEESKVVRQSKGDQHVHLCIYLIDPNSIVSESARRGKSSFPARTQSQTTISATKHDESDGEDLDEEDEEEDDRLTMDPAELRVIKRLATRVNVLPVIARSDELIDTRLRAIKRIVKRELQDAGLGFSVFASTSLVPPLPSSPATDAPGRKSDTKRVSIADDTTVSDSHHEGEEEEEEEERESRPVIRIRSTRGDRSRSRRRSTALSDEALPGDYTDEEPPLPDGAAALEGANTGRVTKAVIEALLPFALVSPQPNRQPRKSLVNGEGTEGDVPGTPLTARSTAPPSSFPANMGGYQDQEPPREFPRGKFIRKYRWGTLDVLDPAHSDFIPMRTAILGIFFRSLKINTREVLYEKYRTDKLLARRATQNISEDERKRLLKDLGL